MRNTETSQEIAYYNLYIHDQGNEILVGRYDTYQQAIKAQTEFGNYIYSIEAV